MVHGPDLGERRPMLTRHVFNEHLGPSYEQVLVWQTREQKVFIMARGPEAPAKHPLLMNNKEPPCFPQVLQVVQKRTVA